MGTENRKHPSRFVKTAVKDENMIYGLRAVIETLEAGRDLEKVFIQKNLQGDLAKELWSSLKGTFTPISKVPIERLNRFTRKNHQGVVAFLSPVKYYTLDGLVQRLYEDGRAPLLVALDGITDVRNFGAIARTAECMGADGLIIPTKGSVQINADAMKTSAGALSSLPVCRTEDLASALQYLKDSGLALVGCSEKADQPISAVDFFSPVTIVMGSEESGISNEVTALCDQLGKIPMHGTIQSLNVSVATAMILYEVTRQRG